MYCENCGNKLENNEQFCNKCGKKNYPEQSQIQFNNIPEKPSFTNKISFKGKIVLAIGSICGTFILILMIILVTIGKNYYFSSESYGEENKSQNSQVVDSSRKKSKYSTSIVYDHTYLGIIINSMSDANKLIQTDSVDQKNMCSKEVVNIENNIINNYGITAVNLCEMDVAFASELERVVKVIYDNYPSARGLLTNLSLANVSLSNGYIAAFMPSFIFGEAKSVYVNKSQILLNSSYFLNPARMQATVTSGSDVGHFPKNATMYSPVAHEFGHYLSFVSMINHYNFGSMLLINDDNYDLYSKIMDDFIEGKFSLKLIEEAYDNYKKDTNKNITLLEFRSSISAYAVAKDNSGNYIYDETIAEAFHDYYLNGDNACEASKYIVNVLKKYVEKVGA